MTAASPLESLAATQAHQILRANHGNLIKKVHAGRTLSAGEVNLLQAIQDGGRAAVRTFANSQVELAELLGVVTGRANAARDGHSNAASLSG